MEVVWRKNLGLRFCRRTHPITQRRRKIVHLKTTDFAAWMHWVCPRPPRIQCPCNGYIYRCRCIGDSLRPLPILCAGKNTCLILGKRSKGAVFFLFQVPMVNLCPAIHCQRYPEYLVDSCLRSRQIASPSRPQARRRMARCDQAFELELRSLQSRRHCRIFL